MCLCVCAIVGAIERNQSLRILYVGECVLSLLDKAHMMLVHVHACNDRACAGYVFRVRMACVVHVCMVLLCFELVF